MSGDDDDDADNQYDDDDADNQDDDDNDDDQNDDNTDNEGDDQDDDNEQTELDNDDDDIVYPKLSTFDEEQRKDEEDKEEAWSENEASNEETQGVNAEEEELDEEETNEEDKLNELYRDQSSSVSYGFVSNMLNPSLDTGIDSIFNLNTASTSLVDVLVTTIAETPLLFATTLPPPPTPLITHLQQTPVPTPETIPSSSLHDLPNFCSLFGFDHRLKTLENNFSEFKKTNQFTVAVSSIPGIVDIYLANKMNEAIKTEQVKEQVKAQVSKILPKIKKTVNEQLKAEVLTRSSNESKTSYDVATNLSKLELKKILIDKMESNKSIHRFDE
ncbi:hypothetical protein Tco_1177774 [Tanacetum coccineum]